MSGKPKYQVLFIFTALSLALASGCTWVKQSPAAAKVRIVPADRVADCTQLGTVTADTTANITVVQRSRAKVEKELETLAQNEAADAGADTIVASSEIVDGRQTFTMYRCLN